MRIRIWWMPAVLFSLIAYKTQAQTIEPRDCQEIRRQGRQCLERFEQLLNQLADPFFFPSEREELIRNSFDTLLPGRIFYDASVIIEEDLTPKGRTDQNTGLNDKKAERYLHDFDLNYKKTEDATVSFSNLHFGPIQEGAFILLHIVYDSALKGRHKDRPDAALPAYKRTAAIRAEKTGGQWQVYLQQINFYHPGFAFVLEHRDTDCDGLIDGEDECPETAGPQAWGGCPPPPDPDSDRDGLADQEDACPDQAGPWCNQGCPVPAAGPAVHEQVQWQEWYGDAGRDVVFDIIRNERGELVFAGETEIAGKGKELYLGIRDPCRRNIRNRIVLGGNQDDGARKVIQVQSGLYALAGYTESNHPGTRDAWLLLTDGVRKTSEQFFGDPTTFEEFTDIAQDRQGNLFLTGEKEGKLWLLQSNPEGQVLKEVLYRGAKSSRGTALALSADGAVYLTGYETEGRRTALFVLRYDPQADALEKIFARENARGLDIIVDREGKLAVAGATYAKRTRDDILAIRLDPTGAVRWPEAVVFGDTGTDVGCAIHETAAGNYLLAGYSNSYAYGARREKLWAHLLDRTGSPLWKEPLFFGNRQSDRAYAITETAAGHIVLSGFSHAHFPGKKATQPDFWLVGIDTLE